MKFSDFKSFSLNTNQLEAKWTKTDPRAQYAHPWQIGLSVLLFVKAELLLGSYIDMFV